MFRKLALMTSLSAALAAAMLAPGCGTTPAGADSGASELDAGPLGSKGPGFLPDGALMPPPPGSFEVAFGPVTVPGGTEKTQCVVKRVGNGETLRVGRMQNRLGNASHHLIVYRTEDTEERPTPFDCIPFVDTLDPTKGAPLMVTQKSEEELTLPKGVAFTFAPNQLVRLELHYVNASAQPKELRASSTFIGLPASEYRDEADFLFVGNPDIKLPPRSKVTLGPTFLPLPETHEGVHFFAMTGHEHQFGKNVKVEIATAKGAPTRAVYDVPDWIWSEPKTVFHDPPVDVPKGGGFQFTCDWENTSDKQVSFGEKADNEMCFFWAYYYPSRGPQVCVHTDQLKSGPVDVCCPGDLRCGFLKQFQK